MIILHCAISEETKQKVYGYVLREDGKVFIVREDGEKISVRAATVMPYQACHRLEDYISLTERTLAAFHEQKIYLVNYLYVNADLKVHCLSKMELLYVNI